MIIYFIVLSVTFLGTVIILRKLIPYLSAKKIGQKILEIGPSWHKNKNGTPTMGGIAFVISGFLAIVLVILLFFKHLDGKEIALIINICIYGVLNALIGLVDDIAKIKQKRNEGLTARQKFMLQAIVAILFLVSLRYTVHIDPIIDVPFLDKSFNVGWLYYVISFFMLCGIVNSVNLTDGIDGLASTVTLIIGVMLSIAAFFIFNYESIKVFSALLVGSTSAFLIFNHHPARVFMGDTGSLFLGAIIVGSSFITNNVLLVLVYGFVYVCEAASDILQVSYYKITRGKRLFKMAPLHHHFEKMGWSENKTVFVFSFVSVVCCLIAYLEMCL